MLLTEWKTEDAIKVWYAEGREEGWAEGREEGWAEGRISEREEIAKQALAEGATLEFVQKITGLDMDVIREIQAGF